MSIMFLHTNLFYILSAVNRFFTHLILETQRGEEDSERISLRSEGILVTAWNHRDEAREMSTKILKKI